jgi:uncharacterized protein YecE (DUF72 family)
MLMTVRVGTSGWSYRSWHGGFYPAGTRSGAELAFLASQLNSAELNASFYRLQTPERYRRWAAQAPPGFEIAVKGSRFITHLKKLRDADTALANFLASGVLELQDKLGPILWQLPAAMTFDEPLLDDFLGRLPRTTADAADLAGHHDGRVVVDPAPPPVDSRPLRHALEVRDESYRDSRFLDLLRRHRIALVSSDGAGRWPQFLDVTTDLAYVRLHGAEELYTSGYDSAALSFWADRIEQWAAAGNQVSVYFDNDARGRAPLDARALLKLCRDRGLDLGDDRGGGASNEATMSA